LLLTTPFAPSTSTIARQSLIDERVDRRGAAVDWQTVGLGSPLADAVFPRRRARARGPPRRRRAIVRDTTVGSRPRAADYAWPAWCWTDYRRGVRGRSPSSRR
jgi:hypothetical protein